MKYKTSCNKTDHLIYLTDDEMDPQEILLLSKHIESCSSCKKLRDDILITRRSAVNLQAALPDYPDFASSAGIFIQTGHTRHLNTPVVLFHPGWHKALSIIRYASGIAALFLLVLFLWEQTTSVYKISKLENRVQTTTFLPETGLIDRITIARAACNDQEWKALAISLKINPAYGPGDLLKLKFLIEERIRSGVTDEPCLTNLFRNSPQLKRSTITLKNYIQ